MSGLVLVNASILMLAFVCWNPGHNLQKVLQLRHLGCAQQPDARTATATRPQARSPRRGCQREGEISFKFAKLQHCTFAGSPGLSALLKKTVFTLGGELLPPRFQQRGAAELCSQGCV